MGLTPLDPRTRNEIKKVTRSLLRDAGITAPPVRIPGIIEHLQLYREFYDLQNPSFLDRSKHKIVVGARKLVEIVKKVRLVAVLFYDEDRIVVDTRLPDVKHDWTTCHEVAHKMIPWHEPYFRGDTAQTLDPDWHEQLEAEANYAASDLMFCGRMFTVDARDITPNWTSFMQLRKRYGKSMTATLRRFVEQGPDRAMAMMTSTPFWRGKPADQPERWRQFAASPQFRSLFSSVTPETLLAAVDLHSEKRNGGPVAEFAFCLDDDNGVSHEFYVESFNNTHYILTLFVEIRRRSARRIIVPRRVVL